MVAQLENQPCESSPERMVRWVLRLAMPFRAEIAAMRLPLTNERATRELGWTLQFPTCREGVRDIVRRLGAAR